MSNNLLKAAETRLANAENAMLLINKLANRQGQGSSLGRQSVYNAEQGLAGIASAKGQAFARPISAKLTYGQIAGIDKSVAYWS